MIFKQTEEGDFQWEENDELIRTGCVLVGPLTHEIGNDTDVRNTFKLICLYFLQVNVAQRLNGENVIVVSRLLLRVWTVAIEWEEHLSPPCHPTTPSSPPGNSKRIRPRSQKQVLPCLTIPCHAFLFLSLGGIQLQLQSTTSPAINPLVPSVTCVPYVNMMTCCRPGLPRLVLFFLCLAAYNYITVLCLNH